MSRFTGRPSRRTDPLRDRGFRGGRIAPHRAMIGLEVSWTLLVDVLVLPTVSMVAMLLLLDPLMDGWRSFFEFVRVPLGLPGGVSTRIVELGPLYVAVPYFTSEAAWPTTLDMISGWVLVGVLAVLGVLLRGRWVPAAYFMRFLAIVQLTAQVWFWLAPPPFAYSLPDYISGLVVCGVVVLLLAPFLVGFTFHVFDFLLWQKAAMVVLLLGHLAIMLPMQATIHAWMIQRGSLLAMPMLYFVFGVLIDVFVYVALYGWGMSWRSGGVLDAVDRRPPVVPQSQLRAFPRPRPTPAVGGPIVPPKGGPSVAPGA